MTSAPVMTRGSAAGRVMRSCEVSIMYPANEPRVSCDRISAPSRSQSVSINLAAAMTVAGTGSGSALLAGMSTAAGTAGISALRTGALSCRPSGHGVSCTPTRPASAEPRVSSRAAAISASARPDWPWIGMACLWRPPRGRHTLSPAPAFLVVQSTSATRSIRPLQMPSQAARRVLSPATMTTRESVPSGERRYTVASIVLPATSVPACAARPSDVSRSATCRDASQAVRSLPVYARATGWSDPVAARTAG